MFVNGAIPFGLHATSIPTIVINNCVQLAASPLFISALSLTESAVAENFEVITIALLSWIFAQAFTFSFSHLLFSPAFRPLPEYGQRICKNKYECASGETEVNISQIYFRIIDEALQFLTQKKKSLNEKTVTEKKI